MPSANQPSKRYRFRAIDFWAEKGRCWLLDLSKEGDSALHCTEKLKTLAPGELMKRAIAVRMGCDSRYPDKVFEARKLLEEATIVAKWAWHQGDPSQQKVLDHYSLHRPHRRSHVSMQDGRLLLPSLNEKYVFKGDPRGMLLNGVATVPDFSVPQGMTPEKVFTGLKKMRKG